MLKVIPLLGKKEGFIEGFHQGNLDEMSPDVSLSTEDLESNCQSAATKVFRYQKILQGTSFHILAAAVGRSPSVLEALEPEKTEKVIRLSGSTSSPVQPKVH